MSYRLEELFPTLFAPELDSHLMARLTAIGLTPEALVENAEFSGLFSTALNTQLGPKLAQLGLTAESIVDPTELATALAGLNLAPYVKTAEMNTALSAYMTTAVQTALWRTRDRVFYPAENTGNDSAALQAACDATVAAGGGIVQLGNRVWACTSGLTIKANYTALRGTMATLNFTGTYETAITIVGDDPDRGGTDTLENSGIIIRGASTINRAVFYDQATNPAQENASRGWSRCAFLGFNNTIWIGRNAYIMSFRDCAFGNAANEILRRDGAANSGERITFDTCTFFNSTSFWNIAGAASDFYFTNCSFDYPTYRWGFWVSGRAVFVGCHFEGRSTSNPPFEFQDNTSMVFEACLFGIENANRDYLMQFYSDYGQVQMINCTGNLNGRKGAFSDPARVTVIGHSVDSRGWRSLPTSGNVTINCLVSERYLVDLTGNIFFDNPANGSLESEIKVTLHGDATARSITYGTKFAGDFPLIVPAGGAVEIIAAYDPVSDRWRNRIATGIALYYQAKTRTSGDVSVLASSSYQDFDPNLDLTVKAVAGDVLKATLNCQAGDTGAVQVEWNIETWKAGSVVNRWFGALNASTSIGAWTIRGGDYWGQSATIDYIVKAADIAADGTVTIRLKTRGSGSSGSRPIFAFSGVPFAWSVQNLGTPR